MIEVRRAVAAEMGQNGVSFLEAVRGWLSGLSARFGSWRNERDEDDATSAADPELVAALEFLASIIPEEREDG